MRPARILASLTAGVLALGLAAPSTALGSKLGSNPHPRLVGRVDAPAHARSGRALRSAGIGPFDPGAPGPHYAYVVFLNNAGKYSDSQTDLLSTVRSVLARWVQESQGQITSFTIAGTKGYALSSGVSCANGGAVFNDAAANAYPDVDFGSTPTGANHLIVIAPDQASAGGSSGCEFGVGTLGAKLENGGLGLGNGGRSEVEDASQLYEGLMHELGHNFSLEHEQSLPCYPTSGCSVDEYGNHYAFMGVSYPTAAVASLDSFERTRLGLTTTCEVQTLAAPATEHQVTRTYDLFGRGTDDGTRGLFVTDPTTGQRYSLDWRNYAGGDAGSYYDTYDATHQTINFGTGVTLESIGTSTALSTNSVLLPTSATSYPLTAGQSTTVGGITVTADAEQAGTDPTATAQVTVTLTNPAVSASPALPALSGAVHLGRAPLPGVTVHAVPTGWADGSCFRYQWYDGKTPIAGARSSSFTVPATMLGHTLGLLVEGQRSGNASGFAGTIRPVAYPFTKTPRPVVRGIFRVGHRLAARVGSWRPKPSSFRYQWYVASQQLPHAHRRTLRLTTATVGKRVWVKVTAVKSDYVLTTRTSPRTPRVRRRPTR